MAQFANMFEVDLNNRSYPVSLVQTVSEGNVYSNRIGAYVYADGAPVNLGGACTGLVMRADGTTVPLTGYVEGNAAYVVLDQPSCAIPGPIQVAVNSVVGENITTLLVAYGTVILTDTRNYVEPGTPIPDITELLAEIDNMREATAAAEAAATKSVRYDTAQSLTDAQKTRAQNNISAISKSAAIGVESADYGYGVYVTNDNASGDYLDVDTFPIGRYVLCTSVSSTYISHLPTSPFTGYILTVQFQGNNGSGENNREFTIQIAQHVRENSLYIRAKYASWTAWRTITGEITQLQNLALTVFDGFFTNANIVNFPDYADCNTIPPMTVALYSSVTDLAHKPVNFRTGYIITMNYYGTSSGGNQEFTVQYAHSCRNGENIIWYRSKYSSWTPWKMIGDAVTLNAYRGLKNFTVLGDSISVSLSYPTLSPAYTVTSWATIMANSMNATADIYAQGGMTTAAMLSSSFYSTAVANANNNQFAIICLGINDANDGVSSSTFKTNYTQIINDMLTNHKFVLCCTIPAGLQGDSRTQYNTDINDVADLITGAFVVDVNAYSDQLTPLCHLGHMSSVGYAALASFIERAIDDTIAANTYFYQGGIDQ